MLAAANCDSPLQGSPPRESQINDHYPTVPILVGRLGFVGRFGKVDRQLDARLLGVRLPPLGFLASANLLDDERG